MFNYSDAYTECNIKNQEKEIIDYLNENLNLGNKVKNSSKNKLEEKDEPEVYSTPNCVSPEEKSHQKTTSSSPSTELTKEYYALVPIDSNVLDKELIEQDALSNAFQIINKSQIEDINAKQNIQCVKPTSLCLNSSHTPKINKHSNTCDILKNNDSNSEFIKRAIGFDEKNIKNDTSQTRNSIQHSEADKSSAVCNKTSNLPETSTDKVLDPTYTPDSLITDEPSSSSDYLSAAYAVSPGTVFSSNFSQLNVGENATKMDNIVTISDSGLETSGMLESLNSHKDVTLTDVSLTESTLHDMINDDNNFQDSASNALDKSVSVQLIKRSTSLNSPTGTFTLKDFNERKSNKSSLAEMTSTKEEKQRQNEEIVILESSSLSSETGSWESVFPPKLPEKDLCERFITSERKNALEEDSRRMLHDISNLHHETHDDLCPSLVQKSPYKSTSCFIDAASLADEGDDVLVMQTEIKDTNTAAREHLLEAGQPVSSTLKQDLSPNDWSGSNDNEDSLEQADNKEPDSIQKDLPHDVSESAQCTEYSLCRNPFEGTHKTILSENCFTQFCQKTAEGAVNVEYNNHNVINDTILASNSFIQVLPNTGDESVPVEYNHPRELNDTILGGNGFIQVLPDTGEETVAIEYSRPSVINDTILSGNGYIQVLPNTEEETVAVEYSRPSVTNDTIMAGNGFIQAFSNTEEETIAVEYNHSRETNDSLLTINSYIENDQNTIELTDTSEYNHTTTVCYSSAPRYTTCVTTAANYRTTSVLPCAFSTPNNSIISVQSLDFETYESQNDDTSSYKHDKTSLDCLDDGKNESNKSSTFNFTNSLSTANIIQVDNHSVLGSQPSCSVTKREIENIPIVSGAYIPEPEEPPERPLKALSNSSFWVVDMSSSPKSDISEYSDKLKYKPVEKSIEELRSASKPTNSSESYKSRSSVDSDSSDKSNHKFYIDLSTLPDALTPEQRENKDEVNEKKNIFSMFIDFGDKSITAKEMPLKFSSSPNTKKNGKNDNKSRSKGYNVSDLKNTSSGTIATDATDDNILFEKLESLCADPSISISEIKNIPLNMEYPVDVLEVSNIKRKDNDVINKVIQEEPTAGEPFDLFVKLSDLDKPALKAEPVIITVKRESHDRMSRSIPDHDWRESSQTINLRSSEIISSFHSENALSLNRLFPHLKNDFSRSMPGSLSSRTRSPLRLGASSSPGDIDECQATDVSEMSSVQSSYCRSVVGK